MVPVTDPRQAKKQHHPDNGSENHCAKTVNGDSTPCRVQVANGSQHEEIENEDRGGRILASIDVAPRDDACRHIGHAHRRVVDQQRSKHGVSRIRAGEDANPGDDRRDTEQGRYERKDPLDDSHVLRSIQLGLQQDAQHFR